jgi:protein-tyrosine kinase
MDRIRKALDLARNERARFLLDAPEGSGPSPIARPRTAAPALAIAPEPASVAPAPEEAARSEPIPVALVRPPQPFSGIVEYTKTRVYTPPPGLLESKRIVDPARVDPAAAAFRMLRTQVLQRMDDKGWRSLAVLSPNAEDGKTTTATNLAVSLAYDHRHTVLLVDCDLKHPGIAGALGIAPEFGLDDVLTGRARVEQCLYHPEGFERLVILPARAAVANSSEALSSTRARNLVSELQTRYPERIVLFDLPPILGADDALAFLPLADCALMVVAERSTKREDLLRCMELVTKIPIVGTVLNRSAAVLRAYG